MIKNTTFFVYEDFEVYSTYQSFRVFGFSDIAVND